MIADALPFDSTTAARPMKIAHDQRLVECACATFAAELVHAVD
jgi:hypothetical protein